MFICSPFTYGEGIKKIALTIFTVLQRFRNKLRAGLMIKMLRATFKGFFLQKQTLCSRALHQK